MTMGEKILKLRNARLWSQEELADRIGVSRQAVSRWEAGSAKPDADKIIALCDLFGVSADFLLRDNYQGDISAVAEIRRDSAVSRRERWGRNLTVIGGGGLFLLKLLSSFIPRISLLYTYTRENGTLDAVHQGGMRGFIMYYDLEWFYFLLLTCFMLGVVLVWVENHGFRKKVMDLWNRGTGLLKRE